MFFLVYFKCLFLCLNCFVFFSFLVLIGIFGLFIVFYFEVSEYWL